MKGVVPEERRLIVRLKKVQGQLTGVAKELEENGDCVRILQQISAAKGGLQALMNEVLRAHLNEHLPNANTKTKREEEIKHIVSMLQSYIK